MERDGVGVEAPDSRVVWKHRAEVCVSVEGVCGSGKAAPRLVARMQSEYTDDNICLVAQFRNYRAL